MTVGAAPLGETCEECGERYRTVYRLADNVWRRINPDPYSPTAGLLCPPCADTRARAAGLELFWTAAVGRYPILGFPLESADPLPQPAQPTMNLLVDERTRKP